MKKYLLLSILLLALYSCKETVDNKTSHIVGDTFISKTGTYCFGKKKIVVKEFKDGSLVFGVSTNKNELLYQSDF